MTQRYIVLHRCTTWYKVTHVLFRLQHHHSVIWQALNMQDVTTCWRSHTHFQLKPSHQDTWCASFLQTIKPTAHTMYKKRQWIQKRYPKPISGAVIKLHPVNTNERLTSEQLLLSCETNVMSRSMHWSENRPGCAVVCVRVVKRKLHIRTGVWVQFGAIQCTGELFNALLVAVHFPVSADEELPASHGCSSVACVVSEWQLCVTSSAKDSDKLRYACVYIDAASEAPPTMSVIGWKLYAYRSDKVRIQWFALRRFLCILQQSEIRMCWY